MRSDIAAAQVSAADLANARLTAQADLAVDYFELRTQDALKQLLDSTVVAYRESLRLEQVLLDTGIANDEAVAQAETQLETAEAQDTSIGIARAQFEHAIALLVGQPASTFSIPPEALKAVALMAVPFGVPSQLLERRPDIAASERSVAQANAQIGVARAAFFPNGYVSRVRQDFRARPSPIGLRGRAASCPWGPRRGGNDFRRGIAACDSSAVPGTIRRDRGELPRNGADRVSTGGE